MNRSRISVVIDKDNDGYYALCPELPGCYIRASTYVDALNAIHDAIHLRLADKSIASAATKRIEQVAAEVL